MSITIKLILLLTALASFAAVADKGDPVFEPTCPNSAEFGQTPVDPTTTTLLPARESSTSDLRGFEYFEGLQGQVVALRWWGTYFDNGETPGPCTRNNVSFTVRFWEDDNGLPGRNVAALSGVLAPTQVLNEDGQVYLIYGASISPAVILRKGWVSIAGASSADGGSTCEFHWMLSDEGDGIAAEEDLPSRTRTVISADFAVCLVTEPFPEGEAAPEEGEGEGEGGGEAGPAEGEAEPPLDDAELLDIIQGFASADTNGDGLLTLTEVRNIAGAFDINDIEQLDRDLNEQISVWEILEYRGEGAVHRADLNGDLIISLSEVLRAIQLFNAGAYDCAAIGVDTEDGYLPDAGLTKGDEACRLHSADTNGNREIDLGEILRIIQFYNDEAYYDCPDSTEDGFCPGMA